MLLFGGGGSGGNVQQKSTSLSSSLLLLVSLLATASVVVVVDAADSTYTAVPYASYQKYWTDAGDVLKNLDNYQALWIKPHGCV